MAWQKFPWRGRSSLNLIDEKEIYEYIGSGAADARDVRVFRSGQAVPPDQYCEKLHGREVIHPRRINALVLAGCSLVLNSIHRHFRSLAEFSEQVSAEINDPVGVNCYYTPPNEQAFPCHFDTHDVFVIQLAGEKSWRLYDNPVEAPIPDEACGFAKRGPGNIILECNLHPHAVHYIPRGYYHCASTKASKSLHLTVGVHPYTWFDDLQRVVQAIASSHAVVRRDAEVSTRDDVLALIAAELTQEAISLRRSERLRMATANPPVNWVDIDDFAALDLNTAVQRTPGLNLTLQAREGTLTAEAGDVSVRVDRRRSAALSALITSREPVRVGDLPGQLTDNEKVNLVTILVREGVIRRSSA